MDIRLEDSEHTETVTIYDDTSSPRDMALMWLKSHGEHAPGDHKVIDLSWDWEDIVRWGTTVLVRDPRGYGVLWAVPKAA